MPQPRDALEIAERLIDMGSEAAKRDCDSLASKCFHKAELFLDSITFGDSNEDGGYK